LTHGDTSFTAFASLTETSSSGPAKVGGCGGVYTPPINENFGIFSYENRQ